MAALYQEPPRVTRMPGRARSSEPQAVLYNWRKNPGADPTVVGAGESLERHRANRYGLYHVSGNAAEWTASLYRHYNVEQPYREDDRNPMRRVSQRQ